MFIFTLAALLAMPNIWSQQLLHTFSGRNALGQIKSLIESLFGKQLHLNPQEPYWSSRFRHIGFTHVHFNTKISIFIHSSLFTNARFIKRILVGFRYPLVALAVKYKYEKYSERRVLQILIYLLQFKIRALTKPVQPVCFFEWLHMHHLYSDDFISFWLLNLVGITESRIQALWCKWGEDIGQTPGENGYSLVNCHISLEINLLTSVRVPLHIGALVMPRLFRNISSFAQWGQNLWQ